MFRFWKRKKKDDGAPPKDGGDRRDGADRRADPLWKRVLRGIGSAIMAVLFFFRGFIKWLLFTIAGLAIIAILLGVGYVYSPELTNWADERYPAFFDAHIGSDRSVVDKLHDPTYFAEQSEIFSEDDKKVACISSPVHRVKITDAAEVPEVFRQAIISSEDKNFMHHKGVDRDAVTRAFLKRVAGESSSGASTLTMQVAKDLRNGTGRRANLKEKMSDAITALRIEREFSKQEILLKYVNMPYFGRGQYGIEAASRAYFGKSAKDLEVQQVAFIVALINKPALPDRSFANDPSLKDPKAIKNANWQEVLRGTRRVLSRMRDDGYLTEVTYARAAEAVDRTLRTDIISRGLGCGANDHFLEHVRVSIKDRFPINKGGLTISITRDDALQAVMTKAVKLTMDTYLARHKDDPDNGELRAGAFAIEFTGDVLAEVGNVDFSQKYDVIANGWRQPGSTFKIITYGGLVEEITNEVLGMENPPQDLEAIVQEVTKRCKVVDAPIGVSLGRGRGIKMIQNFRSNSEPLYRGEIPCQLAIGESRNTAAMRAGARAGIKHVIELAYRLGMPKDPKHILQPYPTTAIGASEVNPLAMSGTASFVNGGFKITPRFMNDVCKDGRSLLYMDDDGRPRKCDTKGERRPVQERVMHPAVSATMIELLKGPLDGFVMEKTASGKIAPHFTGTARALRDGIIPGLDPLSPEVWQMKPEERKKRMLAFPLETSGEIGGKTGTATNADGRTSDVWLILFIPGPDAHPEKGVMLGFWMGKDSKDHPLGDRGTGTNKGFAESGGRNWVHSAATVLAFLQKERGLLKPGHKFRPIYRDATLQGFDVQRGAVQTDVDPNGVQIVDPTDPNADPALVKQIPPEEEPSDEAPDPNAPPSGAMKD